MEPRPIPARTLEVERNVRLAREVCRDVGLAGDPATGSLEQMAARSHAGILAFLGANRERVRRAVESPLPANADSYDLAGEE